jgi:hypothetical protein
MGAFEQKLLRTRRRAGHGREISGTNKSQVSKPMTERNTEKKRRPSW